MTLRATDGFSAMRSELNSLRSTTDILKNQAISQMSVREDFNYMRGYFYSLPGGARGSSGGAGAYGNTEAQHPSPHFSFTKRTPDANHTVGWDMVDGKLSSYNFVINPGGASDTAIRSGITRLLYNGHQTESQEMETKISLFSYGDSGPSIGGKCHIGFIGLGASETPIVNARSVLGSAFFEILWADGLNKTVRAVVTSRTGPVAVIHDVDIPAGAAILKRELNAIGEFTKFKIKVTYYGVEFYINDVLVSTYNGSNFVTVKHGSTTQYFQPTIHTTISTAIGPATTGAIFSETDYIYVNSNLIV